MTSLPSLSERTLDLEGVEPLHRGDVLTHSEDGGYGGTTVDQ
jgi:hypothetical protein